MTTDTFDFHQKKHRRQLTALILLGGLLGVVAVFAGLRLQERLRPPPMQVRSPLAVKAVTLEPGTFILARRYTGSIEAERRVVLSAQLTASVTAVPHREGAQVRARDLLIRLDPSEQTQETQRLTAASARIKADLAFWRGQLTRDETLFRDRVITARAVEETRRTVASLEASLRENRHALETAHTRRGYAEVRAPFDGVVQRVHVLPGELAVPGKPLLEVVAAEPLKAVVPVPQADLADLRAGLAGRITVPAIDGVWEGHVDRVYPALDEATRSATLEMFLPRGLAALRPGMMATVDVELVRREGVLTVPHQAVHERNGTSGVFAVDGEQARWRPVTVGPAQGGAVLIEQGLRPGERVIVTPDPGLADGLAVLAVHSGVREP